jgi:uncharacterized protein (DUF58 family)
MAKAPVRFKREQPWKRHLRFTREGKAFAMVTLGVGVAAFNTGNNLLFLILGLMLSLIVLSGILSEIAIRGVRVSRRLPDRAFAGSVALIEIALQNKKDRAPSYSLEVEDLAEGVPSERRCYFLKVAPGAEQVASYRRVPKVRGPLRLSGFRLATRYPFGIFEKWRMLEGNAELLVYPQLLDDMPRLAEQTSLGVDAPTTRLGGGHEIAGLRAYQEGDEARQIHWRRTAALGRIVVFERQRDETSRLVVVLDNARPEGAGADWEQSFEALISRAATLVVQSAGRETSVEVVARGSRSPVLSAGSPPDPVLRYLALLQSVPSSAGLPLGPFPRGARVVELSTTAQAAA